MNSWNANDDKPVLLLFPFEQLAHYLRCLTLAKKLQPYFEIRVAYSERYAAFIKEAGFETFLCEGLDVDAVLECVKRFDFSWMAIEHLTPVLQRQIAAIEKWKPDLVLGDATPTLKMAAEKTGVPYVSLQNGYTSKYYAGVRTMSRRFPLYPYFKFLPATILDPLTQWGEEKTFRKIHEPFAILRQRYRLLKKLSYADELEGDLNLICDLPELFPLKKFPDHYQSIPPLIYEAPIQDDGVLKKLENSKRTIFVSMGSTGDWQEVQFLNEAAFQQYNIITAGDKNNMVKGPHVTALPFVNVQQLFPHVDLVLCHGGNGTIYQALQFSIPLLCKTAHFEQEWNVQALEKKGLGASLDSINTIVGYQKKTATWIDKKGSAPFLLMQQKLIANLSFDDVINKMQRLVPGQTRTVYFEPDKKSA